MKNMKKLEHIKAIAFDADDTLWALQTYFEEVEAEYCDLLSDYGSKEEISAALFETEGGKHGGLGIWRQGVHHLISGKCHQGERRKGACPRDRQSGGIGKDAAETGCQTARRGGGDFGKTQKDGI